MTDRQESTPFKKTTSFARTKGVRAVNKSNRKRTHNIKNIILSGYNKSVITRMVTPEQARRTFQIVVAATKQWGIGKGRESINWMREAFFFLALVFYIQVSKFKILKLTFRGRSALETAG